MLLQKCNMTFSFRHLRQPLVAVKYYSTVPNADRFHKEIELSGHKYLTDEWTNLTSKIISKLGTNLHIAKYHPLSFVRQRIVNYFYKAYRSKGESPLFSVYDNLSPIVTTMQNFDSLLISKDHPSRNKTDCYYINRDILLRAHTTAHQSELISMGLNNFLVVGDVYRRDEIDVKHYPVFHQVDAVRICTAEEVFKDVKNSHELNLFEHRGNEGPEKQGCHTLEAVKIMEHDLKNCLVGLAQDLFGKDINYQWTDQYFPFTHPSWELEVFYNNEWIEILGCGIMRQEILEKAGATARIGWAFGLGLERLTMCLYNIPDIRLFWSRDSGFLNQFKVDNIYTPIEFKPVSIHPPCTNDMSFWLPDNTPYSSNDFYDIVREIADDRVEQIHLIDTFVHPQTERTSHCYRIVYRHMERTLPQREVSQLHNRIRLEVTKRLKVTVR